MKVKNNNENNNIIVLDFGDYEIQKKKKKKPKKKVNNKKKAVDELKETLQQFDAVLNEAKEKNIEIPKELGELPVNIEDINTIRELNELNADLQQRIINITELIESGGEPQIPAVQTIDPRMFGESGFLQGIQPQPIVVQRQQQGIIEPTTSTTETQTEPTKPPQPVKDTDLEKVRQQLKDQEKAIIDRLPADKREEALKKLKEQASKKPVDTSKEDAEKMGKEDLVKPSLSAGFQIIKPDDKRDVKILGESFESPIGLYDEWEAAKGFIERSSNLGKEDSSLPNVVNISVKDFEDFKKEQKAKLDSYTIYVKNLNPTQLKSIQGEMEVPSRISKEILNVYKTDPKKILEQFYSSKFGRNIKLNIGESGKLPKPKPPKQPKGFSGARVPSTPKSVEAEKILEDMLQEIQNLPPDTDFVPKNFSKFRKSQMRTVLEKIKEASDKNDEEVEFLKGPNPIEIFINKYASNKSKLYRAPLLSKIITQYKKVVGRGSYRFQKKRIEAEEQEEQKVSIVNPNMPNPSAGTGASVGRVEFLSDVNL